MSADLLRKAATVEREEWGPWLQSFRRAAAVHMALADWLDDIAAGWVWDEHPDDVETPDGWPLTLDESMDRHALTVARLIVGEGA